MLKGIIGPALLALVLIGGWIYWRTSEPGLSRPEIDINSEASRLKKVSSKELVQIMTEQNAPINLVNLWATWCPPCVAEFPELLELRAKYESAGVRVFFVSMDSPANIPEVLEFLNERQVEFQTYIKDVNNFTFIGELFPEWSGALPSTLVFNAKGELITAWQGAYNLAQFEEKLKPLLNHF